LRPTCSYNTLLRFERYTGDATIAPKDILMPFLSYLLPFVKKDVASIDADAKAAVAKLAADTAAKSASITHDAAVAKVRAQGETDVSAANSAWAQHVSLIKTDVENRVKAIKPASVLVQLGLTSSSSGPSGPSGATGPA
jgi:hypothetical protein